MPLPVSALKSAAPLLIVAGLLAPSQAGVHAAGTLLRYHWMVGQHFSQATTETLTSIFKTNVPALNGTTLEIDKYTTNTSVTRVFPDGSGLLQISYSNVSITKNGKTTAYPLTGYAHQVRLSVTGIVVSSKTTGAASSDLPSSVTDPTFGQFPQAPIAVGGTWDQKQKDSVFGTLVMHLRLQALGSVQGRVTGTVAITADQPFHASTGGVTFDGRLSASATATFFEDTGSNITPVHEPMAIQAKLGGTINGVKLSGTWTTTGATDSMPVS